MGKIIDKNDFWFIEKNPITKVGVYPYLGKQISQDCEPNKIYYVLRPKEELFRKETLDSLRLIPLIDGHTMIGKDFTAPEDKGLDGTLGDNVSHDTDTIYNDLKIISNKMKEEIQNGKKELSLGYFCRYDKQPGTYKGQRYDYVQRDIIANHLALVDKGRMGADVRVYDSKNIPEGEAFAMDSIDIAIDKDEDIEWITVRGTHVPIKKGESKEQAVKNFLAGKKQSSGNNEDKDREYRNKLFREQAKKMNEKRTQELKNELEELQKRQKERKEDPNMSFKEKMFMETHKKREQKRISEIEAELGKQSGSKAEPESEKRTSEQRALENYEFTKNKDNSYQKEYKNGLKVVVRKGQDKKLGIYHVAEITDKYGNTEKKLFPTENTETVFRSIDRDKDIGKRTTEETTTTKNTSKREKRMFKNGYTYSGEPEQKSLIEEDIRNEKYDMEYEAKQHKKRIGQLQAEIKRAKQEAYPDPEEIERLEDSIPEAEKKYKKSIQEHKERIAELEAAHKEWYGQDSMEYKTIQGEGKMADKKEKVAIDEDKRKLIDEIGGILKDEGLDDEIIRTVIGKAEKIAYNKSEAGDEGEEVEEEVIEEENEEKNKKAAKDKCGKDEEEAKKKEIVKEFAKKEKLAKEVEDALGTFDHSEMTELEIAKYACDKLDLEVEKGQEISAVKGYLKGLAKAPKATFGYKTVAADSGIQQDEEFEKFSKGE